MSDARRLVKHPTQNLWAMIAPGRMKRPDETGAVKGPPSREPARPAGGASEGKKPEAKKKLDPFSPGNEGMTPPEVFRIGEGEPDQPGWQVRVVPNLYPIFDLHEVVILHPEPLDFGEISDEHAVLVFRTYRERYNALKKEGPVFIFHNVGKEAGASLKHPHSQITVVPEDAATFEEAPEIANVIGETERFIAFCPEFSQRPYETWIVSKDGKEEFGGFDDAKLADLSAFLNRFMKRLKEVFGKDVAYNFYMGPGSASGGWYLRLFPRLNIWGPVELGAGIAVNPVDPKDAAEVLGLG